MDGYGREGDGPQGQIDNLQILQREGNNDSSYLTSGCFLFLRFDFYTYHAIIVLED